MVIRSARRHGDFHPQAGHLRPERGEHTGAAGTPPPPPPPGILTRNVALNEQNLNENEIPSVLLLLMQKMLDYLKEKRDVGFFKSLSGLMMSCR